MKRKMLLLFSVTLVVFMLFSTISNAFSSVPVKTLKINLTNVTVNAGQTVALKAYLTPVNATNKVVTWSSSNTAIAKIDNAGNVTGVKAGKVTITVKSADGKVTAKSNITVTAADPLLNTLGQLPIVKKPYTIRILTNQGQGVQTVPSTKVPAYAWLEKTTGVKAVYDSAPWANMQEVITTRLAANVDLPDLISMNAPASGTSSGLTTADVFNYGDSGILLQLTPELMAKNAPGLLAFYKQNPDAQIARSTQDGVMYSIPDGILYRKEWQIGFMINQPWLDKLNLKAPTTTDELYNVLKAFKAKDPNGNGKADELPMVNLWDTLDYMADSWDLQSLEGNHATVYGFMPHADGTVSCDMTDPRYKDYLTYMHKLYAEGLLDKEFSNTTMDTMGAKVQADRVGTFIEWLNFSQGYDSMRDPNYMKGTKVTYPIIKQPKASPKYTAHRFMRPSTVGNWSITSEAKRPDICLRYLDAILFNPTIVEALTWGIKGDTYKVDANGKHSFLGDPSRYITMGFGQWSLPNRQNGWDDTCGPALASDKTGSRSIVDIEPFPSILPLASEREVTDQYSDNVLSYFRECRAKFITGDMPLSDFDKYVKEMKKRGTDKLAVVYTAQLKRARAIQSQMN